MILRYDISWHQCHDMSYLKIISQNFVISPQSKQMRRRQLMSADAAAASIIAQPAPIQGKDEKKISRRSAPFFIILKCQYQIPYMFHIHFHSVYIQKNILKLMNDSEKISQKVEINLCNLLQVLKSFNFVFIFGPHNDTDMTFHS